MSLPISARYSGVIQGEPENQFPLMDGHDHVVVASYSPFTDSQRFHRESRFPRRLLTWRRPLFLARKHTPDFKTLS